MGFPKVLWGLLMGLSLVAAKNSKVSQVPVHDTLASFI